MSVGARRDGVIVDDAVDRLYLLIADRRHMHRLAGVASQLVGAHTVLLVVALV
jgi:hypothetical protein